MQMSEHPAGAAAAATMEHKLLATTTAAVHDPFAQHQHHLSHSHHHHQAQMQLHLLPPPSAPMHHHLAHHGAHSGAFQWHHIDDASKRQYEPQDFDNHDDHGLNDDDNDDHDDNDDDDDDNNGAGASDMYTTAHPSSLAVPSTSMLALGLPATSGKAPRKTKREIFECPEVHCGKVFPRSFALRRHMRIHTGNKPYACDHDGCSQKFNTSGNLSRHKRIHSGERPYPCVYASCGKRFNTSTKLKRHMRIHFPDGQNLFQCAEPTCAWACDNYKEYVTHQRLHGSVADAGAAPARESKPTAAATATARKPAKSRVANAADKAAAASTVAAADAHTDAVQFHSQTDAMATALPVYSRRAPEFQSHQHVHLPQHTPSPDGVHYGEREYDARRSFGQAFDLREHSRESEQHHHSGSTGSSLHERDLDLEHEYESSELSHGQSHHSPYHMRRDVKHEDRPRLPFPTQSFPSESSFHHSHLHAPPHHAPPVHHRPAYFEHASGYSTGYGGSSSNVGSAYGSYMRGPHDGYASSHHHQQQHHHHPSSSSEPRYESHYGDSGRHSEDSSSYESPVNARASHVSEDVKYAYAAAGITPTPEFTGEELSAVLELMKDS